MQPNMKILFILLVSSLSAFAGFGNGPVGGTISGGSGITSGQVSNIVNSSASIVDIEAKLLLDSNNTLIIWTNGASSSNTYTFPSSTTSGFNEAQQFVPWTTSGSPASGFKLAINSGVLKFSTPLWITNNEWVVGAGGPSTVFQYIGNTNLYTMANVTNALTNGASYCGLLNIYGLGNKLAGGTVVQLPNVTLEGFSIVTSTNMWCSIIYANAFNLVMKDIWVGNSNLFGPTDFHVGFVEPSVITEPQKSVGLITYGSTSVELHHCFFEGLADGFCSAGNTYTYVDACQPVCCGTWNGNHSSAYPTTSELSLGFGVGTISKGNPYYTSVSKLTSYQCDIAAYFNTFASQITDSQPQGDVHPIGLWMNSSTLSIAGCQIDYPAQPPVGYVTAITNDASLNFNVDSTHLINVSVPVTAINNSGWSREFYSGNNPILELLDDNGFNGTPGVYILGTNTFYPNNINTKSNIITGTLTANGIVNVFSNLTVIVNGLTNTVTSSITQRSNLLSSTSGTVSTSLNTNGSFMAGGITFSNQNLLLGNGNNEGIQSSGFIQFNISGGSGGGKQIQFMDAGNNILTYDNTGGATWHFIGTGRISFFTNSAAISSITNDPVPGGWVILPNARTFVRVKVSMADSLTVNGVQQLLYSNAVTGVIKIADQVTVPLGVSGTVSTTNTLQGGPFNPSSMISISNATGGTAIIVVPDNSTSIDAD